MKVGFKYHFELFLDQCPWKGLLDASQAMAQKVLSQT